MKKAIGYCILITFIAIFFWFMSYYFGPLAVLTAFIIFAVVFGILFFAINLIDSE